MKKKTIVIGAGVAGLATALRLAKEGCEVQVFESNNFYGGKINSKWLGPYRFDRGPSVFTGPTYIKELYDLVGADFKDFELVELDHSFHYFFNDNQRIVLPTEKEAMIEELSSKLNENPDTIRKHLIKNGKNYEAIAPLFIEQSLHLWSKVIGKPLFKALSRIFKYKLFSTMHQVNQRTFKNPRTAQIFNRFATYNGSDPYQAPAMLNMIAHLEMNQPLYLPKNGMIQITKSIYDLAVAEGVQFHFEEKVDRILHEGNHLTGVETEKGTYTADAIFSNMDVSFTYEKLLPNVNHPTKILAQERSSSAIVFYWGITKSFPELDLHNIFFADNYAEEFDYIFNKKELYHDPTIYVNITSKYVIDDAPDGHENWFVMINAPTLNNQNWDEIVPRLKEIHLKKLGRILGEDIEPLIATEEIMDPPTIERRYSGKGGAIYGNASNNRFAAFYRHANFSKEIDNLYFVGVSVHPGGGIPLALNSAKIAVEEFRKRQ